MRECSTAKRFACGSGAMVDGGVRAWPRRRDGRGPDFHRRFGSKSGGEFQRVKVSVDRGIVCLVKLALDIGWNGKSRFGKHGKNSKNHAGLERILITGDSGWKAEILNRSESVINIPSKTSDRACIAVRQDGGVYVYLFPFCREIGMYFNNLDGIRIGFIVYSYSNRFHYKTNMGWYPNQICRYLDGIQLRYFNNKDGIYSLIIGIAKKGV